MKLVTNSNAPVWDNHYHQFQKGKARNWRKNIKMCTSCARTFLNQLDLSTHIWNTHPKMRRKLFLKTQLIKDTRIRLHCTKCGKAFICKADQNIHSSKGWEQYYYQFQKGKAGNWRVNFRLVKPAPNVSLKVLLCMRPTSSTKLAGEFLQPNMYIWVLEASMVNFKITSTITAI